MVEELERLEKVSDVVSRWAGISYVIVAIEGLPAVVKGGVGEYEVERSLALASDMVSKVEGFEDVDVSTVTLRERDGLILVRFLPNRFMIIVKGREGAVAHADEVLTRVITGDVTKCGGCGAVLEYLNIKCPNCGSVIPSIARKCHACGAVVGARSCPNCGTRIGYDGKPLTLNRRRLAAGLALSLLAGCVAALAGHALGVSPPVAGFAGGVVGLTGIITSYLTSMPMT